MNKAAILNVLLLLWGILEILGFTFYTPKIFMGVLLVLLVVVLVGQFLKYTDSFEQDRREIYHEKSKIFQETITRLKGEVSELKRKQAFVQGKKQTRR